MRVEDVKVFFPEYGLKFEDDALHENLCNRAGTDILPVHPWSGICHRVPELTG